MRGIYAAHALILPTEWLVWLATSGVRLAVYRLQGWHAPIRFVHLAATSVFFGGIVLLDLRILQVAGRAIALEALSRVILPYVHAAFGLLMASGVWLFLYDPIQTGSHSWFLPKLLLVVVGVGNAAVFSRHRWGRIAAVLSIVVWTGAIACATANQEERPLIPGRSVTRALAPNPA